MNHKELSITFVVNILSNYLKAFYSVHLSYSNYFFNVPVKFTYKIKYTDYYQNACNFSYAQNYL